MGDASCSFDSEKTKKRFVLNEAGPCTSTIPCDEEMFTKSKTKRECYITVNARMNEIRVQQRPVYPGISPLVRNHFHDIPTFTEETYYKVRNRLEFRLPHVPKSKLLWSTGSVLHFPTTMYKAKTIRKRKYTFQEEVERFYHPGISFNCNPMRMQLNDCQASYDKFEHRLRSRRSIYSSLLDEKDNSSAYVHFGDAVAVPDAEPREFSREKCNSLDESHN